MAAIQVYSRQGCHLCEVLVEELLPLIHGRLELEVRDIDTRADWLEKYNARVPAVEYDGELVCEYYLDKGAISRLLDSLVPGQGI